MLNLTDQEILTDDKKSDAIEPASDVGEHPQHQCKLSHMHH